MNYITCPKCRIRKIQEWELICGLCFKAGNDEKLISEVIDDEEDYPEEDD